MIGGQGSCGQGAAAPSPSKKRKAKIQEYPKSQKQHLKSKSQPKMQKTTSKKQNPHLKAKSSLPITWSCTKCWHSPRPPPLDDFAFVRFKIIAIPIKPRKRDRRTRGLRAGGGGPFPLQKTKSRNPGISKKTKTTSKKQIPT